MKHITLLFCLMAAGAMAQDKIALAAGDTIPCQITAADEYHIQFTTADSTSRKVARSAVASAYHNGAWKKTYLLPASISNLEAGTYDPGMLRSDGPYYQASLHLDRAGNKILGSMALGAAAILVASFAADQSWTPYAVGGLSILSVAAVIGSAVDLKRSAHHLSRSHLYKMNP